MNSILILDKPAGLSSNRALSRLKHLLHEPKMGFLGTLDPLATGVLPLFMGKATKLIPTFEGLDKSYRVTLKLGERTDTLDAEGRVVAVCALNDLHPDRVRQAIEAFSGEYRQTVPQYSAVKIGGVPAYRLARNGLPVPERQRTVKLWDLEVESIELPRATFRVACSAGTYMRSLVEDIGLALGVGAHLTALRRLRCGSLFTLENSISLGEIEERIATGDSAMVRNPAEFLTDHLPLTIGADAEQFLRHGQEIPLGAEAPAAGAKMKVVRPCGTLIAVGTSVAHGPHALSFRPIKVLI